jgi:hypothetical protein
MKKRQVRFIVILLMLFVQSTDTFSQYQKEGLVDFASSWFIDFSNVKTKDSMATQHEQMWFKDSCVIYERRTHLETSEDAKEGTVVKKSFPVWRYIYLDLKTMLCQEYLDFKDTSMPFCSYKIMPTDTMGFWNAFALKKKSDTLHGVFPMMDTIVEKKIFKRVKILYKYYEYEKSYCVYYFDCNAQQNIFHLNRTLSDMYPRCKSSRLDFYDSTNKVIIREERNVIRGKLTALEEAVFKQWHKNLINIKLPLIKVSEAWRIPIRNPEHENPTITILPKEEK